MESKYCKELEPGFTPVTICEEAARCLLCHDAPCSKSCPAGTDPGKFIRSVRFRNFKGAAETIRENNILGAICARVCPTEKYCQLACSRCGIDKPIDIGRIQRYVTDLEETLGMKILEKPAHRLGKSVAVVGGGPGGLYAAYTAARRGHKVTLCEAADKTGGLLIGEAAIPFKYDMYLLGETYRHLAEKEGVEIRLNTRVDRAYVEKEAPDAVIVAAGSEPLLPSIPGLRESPIMFPAEDYHLNKDKIGDTCIVIGGGLVGCEMAVCLARDGKNVHIVEMRSELCPDANVRYRPLLMAEMAKYNVNIHTNCTCKSVEGHTVICETPAGEKVEIEGDSILCGLGLVPNTSVVEELRGTAPQFFSIGNCVKPDTITHTVYQGYHAALDI